MRFAICLFLLACRAGDPIGARCASDSECGDGVCSGVGADGEICTRGCADGQCAAGYECALTDAGGLCVPSGVANCQPCQVDADCNQAGLSGYRCLGYGAAGSFCGAACGACPDGYSCDGGACRRAGECACNAVGIALAAETACETVNAFGRCSGMRGCGASGLSACVGAVPAAEVCDGQDNDCDGLTDEGVCTHAAR